MQSILLKRALLHDNSLLSLPSEDKTNPPPGEFTLVGEEDAGFARDGDAAEKQKDKVVPAPQQERIVGFSDNDPLDPKTWSYSRRWIYTLMIAHIAIVVGAAGSINSAAAPHAAVALNVSEQVVLLDTALFLVGFGVAAPIVGPLSEIGGRNPVYLVTLLLFTVLEIGTACTSTIYARCILRFFAGMAGASPLSNAGGSLADMWAPEQRSFAFPVFAVAGFLGPVLGPVLGGFLGEYDYRWCDWTTAIWAALVLVTTAAWMPETFAPTILQMKAEALRQKTGESTWKSPLEKQREEVPFFQHFVLTMKRPFLMLALEPIVLFFCLYMSVVYTVLFGDLVAYAHIFEPYNLSDGVLGLTFLPIAVGLLICGACTPLIFRQYKKEARNAASRGQPLHPEHHLKIAMVGTWLVPISLFWGAWSSYGDVPGSIWSVLLSQVLFGTGILSIFIASYQYIIDAYLSTAASALATLTFVRYPISGGAVMFTPAMYNNLGRHWAMSLLGFISLAMSAIPFVFFRYGGTVRSWSRYAPHVAVQ